MWEPCYSVPAGVCSMGAPVFLMVEGRELRCSWVYISSFSLDITVVSRNYITCDVVGLHDPMPNSQ